MAGIDWALDSPVPKIQRKYHHYDELTVILRKLASECGEILRLFSIGRSAQGRELWGVRVTDHPEEQEFEPEFLYLANIHGDEPVGRELLVHFVRDICTRYAARDEHIVSLVDHTDIYIIFSGNPDGFEAVTRYNHNGVDLNRNFPDQVKGPSSDPQPEMTAVMNFLQSHYFSLGANLHAGTLCCNYPWDNRPSGSLGSKPSVSPDDSLYKHLCSVYSEAHPYMHLSQEFRNGITDGASYFAVYGGLQDYSYAQLGMLHVTLELGYVKYPPASTLPGEWAHNAGALYAYLEQVHTGLRGHVFCTCGSGDGHRIPANATLTFTSLDNGAEAVAPRPLEQHIYTRTRPHLGDYHRVLLPGDYTVKVEGCGGVSSSRQVTVPARPAGPPGPPIADFTLQTPTCGSEALPLSGKVEERTGYSGIGPFRGNALPGRSLDLGALTTAICGVLLFLLVLLGAGLLVKRRRRATMERRHLLLVDSLERTTADEPATGADCSHSKGSFV